MPRTIELTRRTTSAGRTRPSREHEEEVNRRPRLCFATHPFIIQPYTTKRQFAALGKCDSGQNSVACALFSGIEARCFGVFDQEWPPTIFLEQEQATAGAFKRQRDKCRVWYPGRTVFCHERKIACLSICA